MLRNRAVPQSRRRLDWNTSTFDESQDELKRDRLGPKIKTGMVSWEGNNDDDIVINGARF